MEEWDDNGPGVAYRDGIDGTGGAPYAVDDDIDAV